MNVRKGSESTARAYPPPDLDLIKLFYIFADDFRTAQDPQTGLHTLFKVLFDLTTAIVNTDIANPVARLKEHFSNSTNREAFYEDLNHKVQALMHSESRYTASDTQDSLTMLFKKLPAPTSGRVSLVMIIDEAQILTSIRIGSESLYDLVAEAVTQYTGLLFYFCRQLLMNNSINCWIPRRLFPMQPGSRRRQSPTLWPLHRNAFRSSSKITAHDPTLKLEDVQESSLMVLFGRPLFSTYYEAALQTGQNPHQAMRELKMLVGSKLIGSEECERYPIDSGKLALLDVLLSLEYDPLRTQTLTLAKTMVADHMRTVFAFPADRGSMCTGYPSEPVLAETALDIVSNLDRAKNTYSLLRLFQGLERGSPESINGGQCGENMGKLILLRTYITAVKQEQEWEYQSRCLVAEQFEGKVMSCPPDTLSDGIPFETQFASSWLRFRHFVRSADDSTTTSNMAMVGVWRLSAGVVSAPSTYISRFFWTKLRLSRRPTCRGSSSNLNFAQINLLKGRPPFLQRMFTISILHTLRDQTNSFKDAKDAKWYQRRPYISLVMVLGVVPLREAALVVDAFIFPNVAASPARGRAKENNIHPRYSFIHGCSRSVYRSISDYPEFANTYKALLQVGGLIRNHPKGRNLDPIFQMKPVWSVGYSWIDEPFLKPPGTGEEAEPAQLETVEIGVAMEAGDDMDIDYVDSFARPEGIPEKLV